MNKNNHFSDLVSVFHKEALPESKVQLVGYSALIHAFDLPVPFPEVLCALSHKHIKYQKDRWMMFSPRHAPGNTLYGHLTFALKYEGVDLGVLKAFFEKIAPKEIEEIVNLEPTGAYSRRIWFLYEWLKGTQLSLSDAKQGNFVDALNEKLQYPGPVVLSKRHRVRNNMPGVSGFCPTIRKTKKLEFFMNMNLQARAQNQIQRIHADVLLRAAAFLLLKDSKASYAIEGETPPQNRAERWGKAIGQAGLYPLSNEELYRLQEIVISDFRFTHQGFRFEGGFIGEHERGTGMPIPVHISAKWQDILTLMGSLIEANDKLKNSDYNPILAAAVIAFGFVFIHPFEDGNGRIHRYLIHHVLAEKNFTPKGLIFPVSAVILEKIDVYRQVLEAFSKPRLQLIEWRPTEKGNVEVLNETIDLYRYFDATKQAEFLFECVHETIEKTLPEEVDYLQKYDAMKQFINNTLDMPDRLVDLLIRFLWQNQGKLSKRAIDREFSSLTEREVKVIEEKYDAIFKQNK